MKKCGRQDERGAPSPAAAAAGVPALSMVQTQLLDCVRESVVATDLNGHIFYWGPGAEKMYGYTAREVMHKPYRDFAGSIEPVDEAAFRHALITTGSWQGEHRQRRKDGEIFWTSTYISLITDPHGQPAGYIGIDLDITARKQEEAERQRLQELLAQSQKMESVGRLAGGVAHDFNNMLGVIIGHAEMALEQVPPGHPLYDDLDEIRKAAERSATLTRQLLAYARKQTVTPKMLDLAETVEGMLKMLRRLIGENIVLEWRPAADLWPVRMDPAQTDQILTNLVVNARDAIAGVGQIMIEVRNISLDTTHPHRPPDLAPGDYVLLLVSDNGCGMAPATLARIFEPFFTTKEQGQGTGLGLATVYGIVRQNNGHIQAASRPGQGATFSIYLPRYAGQPRMPAPAPGEPPAGGLETILVVEDEPTLLKLATTILERLQYQVLAAGTPLDALRLAAAHTGQIDLLVTDVIMPGMNGRELAEQLATLRPGIRCLFISGHTDSILAHRGFLEEGVHFIQKPFSTRALAAKVRDVLAGKT